MVETLTAKPPEVATRFVAARPSRASGGVAFERGLTRFGYNYPVKVGTTIYRQGDEETVLMHLVSGSVSIIKNSPEGKCASYTLGSGAVLNIGLFLENEEERFYPSEAVAIENCMIRAIDAGGLRELRHNAAFALEVLRGVALHVRALEKFKESLQYDVRTRLTRQIDALATDRDHTGYFRRTRSITQQELTERIGAGREMVSKQLLRLYRQGVIRRICRSAQPSVYEIEDEDTLWEIAYVKPVKGKRSIGKRESFKELVEGVAVVLSRR